MPSSSAIMPAAQHVVEGCGQPGGAAADVARAGEQVARREPLVVVLEAGLGSGRHRVELDRCVAGLLAERELCLGSSSPDMSRRFADPALAAMSRSFQLSGPEVADEAPSASVLTGYDQQHTYLSLLDAERDVARIELHLDLDRARHLLRGEAPH